MQAASGRLLQVCMQRGSSSQSSSNNSSSGGAYRGGGNGQLGALMESGFENPFSHIDGYSLQVSTTSIGFYQNH